MKKVPRLCRHKKYDKAYVTVGGKQKYLGKWGSQEAYDNYNFFVLEWSRRNVSEVEKEKKSGEKREYSLNELLAAFLENFSSQTNFSKSDLTMYQKVSLRLSTLFPKLKANMFGVIEMRQLRDSFQNEGFERSGVHYEYCRNYLNKLMKGVRRIFSWGVGHGYVKVSVAEELKYLEALRIGKTTAPESKTKKIVEDKDFEAVLPFLAPIYQDFVKILRLTGMRPIELCRMRMMDIDFSKEIWGYRPYDHKTACRGHNRFIPLGFRAQEILKNRIEGKKDEDHVFSPKDVMKECWEIRRNRRRQILHGKKAD